MHQRKAGLTLKRLKSLISGPQEWCLRRRKSMRHVLYRVGVPHWLSDYELWDDDFLQRFNNEAFERGIHALFAFLSDWANQTPRLTLSIAVQAESVNQQVHMSDPFALMEAGQCLSFQPYFVYLEPGAEWALQSVSCVSELEFPRFEIPGEDVQENGVSTQVALLIAQACQGDSLFKVHLDATGVGKALTRRRSLAEGLSTLPGGVRSLTLERSGEEIRERPCPGRFSEPTTRPDPLCAALQHSSMSLRELRIHGLRITPELFWANDGESQLRAHWPHLRVLHVGSIPFALPSGEILRAPTCRIVNYQDLWRPKYRPNSSKKGLLEGYFDELFESTGHAALRMPNLKSLWVEFDSHELQVSVSEAQKVVSFYSDYGYAPSLSVLDAWKIPAEKPMLRRKCLEADLDAWPPM